MKCLVTGSEGFIGKNLVARLEQEGHEVILYDRKIDRDIQTYWIEEEDFDVCFHLACVNQMEATIDSFRNVDVNASLTRYIAHEAAKRNAKFIYTSTASVYGNAEEIPTHRNAKLAPLTDYAVAKLAGEFFVQNSGADYTIFRLSNVYGPHQTLDNPYCGVIGRFFEQARAGEPLTVIGSGMQTRDFTYVGDVVDKLIAVINPDLGRSFQNKLLNVSHGRETPVIDIAMNIAALHGSDNNIKHIDPRPIDGISRRCLIPDLTCPTGIYSGLRMTKEWFDQ